MANWSRIVLTAAGPTAAYGLLTVSASAADWAAPVQQAPPVYAQVLGWLANPNVAYLLLVAGLMALLAEASAPGISIPGVAGVIMLILALAGLAQLPTNWVGVLLIVAAAVMLVLDLHLGGLALSIGAIAAFLLGSFLIFTPFWSSAPVDAPRLNVWLVILTVVGVEAFFALGLTKAWQAQHYPVAVGRETMIGKRALVTSALNPAGIVIVEGEEWSATVGKEAHLQPGAMVEVVAVDGLVLLVRAVSDEQAAERASDL